MTAFLIFALIFVAISYYFMIYRNNLVFNLRNQMIEMIRDAPVSPIEFEKALKLYELPKYKSMIYSFKPITVEVWYSELYEFLTNIKEKDLVESK